MNKVIIIATTIVFALCIGISVFFYCEARTLKNGYIFVCQVSSEIRNEQNFSKVWSFSSPAHEDVFIGWFLTDHDDVKLNTWYYVTIIQDYIVNMELYDKHV